MGAEFQDIYNSMDEFHSIQYLSTGKLVKPEAFIEQDQFLDIPFSTPNENLVKSSNTSPEGESREDSDHFSDIALSYISQMLMDEEECPITDWISPLVTSALVATEKPFYEILGEKYPPPNHSSESPDSISPRYGSSSSVNGGVGGSGSNGEVENNWPYDYSEFQLPVGFASQFSFGSINSFSNTLAGSSNGFDGVSNLFLGSMPTWHFNKGAEEARKFLPSDDKLVIDLEANGFSLPLEAKEDSNFVEVKSERGNREDAHSSFGSRGRKNPHRDDLNLEEGRRVKQSAISYEGNERSKMFDDTLLCSGDPFPKAINDLREALHHVASKSWHNGHSKGSNDGKGHGKKQPRKELVDLETLLIQCAQMVSADDLRSANEKLKQIRQHSSPVGDGSQRLAHYFANGIEARLAGTGSDIYKSFRSQRKTATDFLKAYQLYIAACPLKKISFFFSNQTIQNVSKNATSVHIVDFGMNLGFQWPSFLQCISARPGGPPKVRITGIDLPQPGLRPAERIQETGRRLSDYARSFNLPFEFKAIASKWEDVRVEDLDIDKDEVLVVNCLYQLKYLADETVVEDSPRNTVLNTIRKMNPDVFIHGIVNGSYNAPFFVTRFREALYHFSALFDMLETIVPRGEERRLLLEREVFGWEAINVIACEGFERMERPETYKQWQVRIQRAGFVQNPLNEEIVMKAREKVKNFYHKDFVVDEYGRWLVQGWKGRIIFALSSWKPDNAS